MCPCKCAATERDCIIRLTYTRRSEGVMEPSFPLQVLRLFCDNLSSGVINYVSSIWRGVTSTSSLSEDFGRILRRTTFTLAFTMMG